MAHIFIIIFPVFIVSFCISMNSMIYLPLIPFSTINQILLSVTTVMCKNVLEKPNFPFSPAQCWVNLTQQLKKHSPLNIDWGNGELFQMLLQNWQILAFFPKILPMIVWIWRKKMKRPFLWKMSNFS